MKEEAELLNLEYTRLKKEAAELDAQNMVKCSVADEKDKVVECSSFEQCYDLQASKYDNSKCIRDHESCGEWVGSYKYPVQGCIRTEYCGSRGNYFKKENVLYECPGGEKEYTPLTEEQEDEAEKE